ncbi:hypothetical protein ACU4GR_12765 [Methylobacterium oryzae CBMB20]
MRGPRDRQAFVGQADGAVAPGGHGPRLLGGPFGLGQLGLGPRHLLHEGLARGRAPGRAVARRAPPSGPPHPPARTLRASRRRGTHPPGLLQGRDRAGQPLLALDTLDRGVHSTELLHLLVEASQAGAQAVALGTEGCHLLLQALQDPARPAGLGPRRVASLLRLCEKCPTALPADHLPDFALERRGDALATRAHAEGPMRGTLVDPAESVDPLVLLGLRTAPARVGEPEKSGEALLRVVIEVSFAGPPQLGLRLLAEGLA